MKASEMKLISLVTFIHIHLISFIYLSLANQINNNQHQNEYSKNYQLSEVSEETKKFIINQLKANLLGDLKLKPRREPKKTNKKIKVPSAMLEEYLKLRDSMREAVPNDKDFYGNLDLEDVEDTIKMAIERKTREKRQVSGATNYHRKEKHKGCTRRTMVIDFEDVGWHDWVIAPVRYDAYFCSGECSYPMSDHLNATNHAIIQGIFHSVGRIVPKSCCAPIKYERMAMMIQLGDTPVMKKYEEMIVQACGCL